MCGGGCRALPRSRFRHRKPAGLRNPRRGGWAEDTAKEFAGWLAGARCPALRSAGLFGSETGSPRARAALCAAWVSSRGGGRRAEPGLRTSRQEEPAAEAAKKLPPPGPLRQNRSPLQEHRPCLSPKKTPRGCPTPRKSPCRGRPGKTEGPFRSTAPVYHQKRSLRGCPTPRKKPRRRAKKVQNSAFFAFAAATNSRNSGCARLGRLLNSG